MEAPRVTEPDLRGVSDEPSKSERIRGAIYDVAVFNDPDPWRVCTFVAETLAEVYGSNAVITLLRDDFAEFRYIGGKEGTLKNSVGSTLESSICRLPIESLRAVAISDVARSPEVCDSTPARLGVLSYVGAPLLSVNQTVRGALSMMSTERRDDLGEEDVRFVTILAARVAAELERARIAEIQTRAKREASDQEATHLASTREVLDAMVHAFDLVSLDEPIETILVAQTALLENLVGFGSVAIVLASGIEGGPIVATPYEHRRLATTEAIEEVRRNTWLRRDALRQLGLDGFAEGLAVPLGSHHRRFGFLIYESEARTELDDRRRLHLEALSEQVALTLEAYTLRAEIVAQNRNAAAHEAQEVLAGRLASSGLLAATVAHDVKNIVAAISLEVASTAEPLRALAAVRTHLDRFAILSHRLLSYSKPRMLVKRPIDLDELLRRITGVFTDYMRIADIQLLYSPAKMPIQLLGDPHQIEHLFANLLLNAIQAMSAKSGGVIDIRVKRAGKRAIIEVRDTGPGVKEENLDKMFEPFVGFRHEGFGLGLFSARRIANEHGGDVRAVSTPGVGTTLTVTLQAAPIEP